MKFECCKKCPCLSSNAVSLLGRTCLATIFIVSGIGKIMYFPETMLYMASYGLPLVQFGAVMAIIIELGGGLMLLLGWKTRCVAFLIASFVIMVTLVFHNFWMIDLPEATNQMHHFLKNLAIVGGLFYIMAHGAGKYAIDGRKKKAKG